MLFAMFYVGIVARFAHVLRGSGVCPAYRPGFRRYLYGPAGLVYVGNGDDD